MRCALTDVHPQERFIEWVNAHEDVHWVRMVDMADEFRARNASPADARLPGQSKAAT